MIEKTLASIRQKLQLQTLTGLNERNTDRVFVTPMLEALGYDLANLDETVAAFHLKETDNGSEISYAFFKREKLLMLLEIRPLYSDLSALKNIAKVLVTAKASGAPILVLCNGVEWLICDMSGNTDDLEIVAQIDVRQEIAGQYMESLKITNILKSDLGILKETFSSIPSSSNDIQQYGMIKNRGYKVSDYCHSTINRLRTQIMTQRDVKDQEITNSLIVENMLRVFIDGIEKFNYYDISNETILKRRIEEALQQRINCK